MREYLRAAEYSAVIERLEAGLLQGWRGSRAADQCRSNSAVLKYILVYSELAHSLPLPQVS